MSLATPSRPRVHDLIGPLPPGVIIAENAQEQASVDACLARVPFAVVRRAGVRRAGVRCAALPCAVPQGMARQGEHVCVGVRGALRSERYAALLPLTIAVPVIAPEHLRLRGRAASVPALLALAELEARWDGFELPWGPAGSVGFALASGADCVGPQSDLDLVVRAPSLPSRAEAKAWLRALTGLRCRVDVQVETPAGGVALLELLPDHGRVLLRTSGGPRLLTRAACSVHDEALQPRPA